MDFEIANATEIARELGARLKRRRLGLNITLKDLSKKIGIDYTSIYRAETSGKCSLATFIRILQGLESTHSLDLFLPEPPVSPLQISKMKGKERKRAYHLRQEPDHNE